MDYIRNANQLMNLPANLTKLKFNNYIGLRTAKKLKRFSKLRVIAITANTNLTREAKQEIKNRHIEIVTEKEKPGRKRLETVNFPKMADALIEIVKKIEDLVLFNRPISTMAYAEYRLEKNLEIITLEKNVSEIEKRLDAKRASFDVLEVNNVKILLNIVDAHDYEELTNRSVAVSVRTPSVETKARVVDSRSAVLFATKHPTAHSLQDAFTIMYRNDIRSLAPENNYIALFNELLHHSPTNEKKFQELRNYYAHDAPVDLAMVREVVRA